MKILSAPALADLPVSVAVWLSHLSPEAMSAYVFTSYDSLLSWSAMELLLAEDFRTQGAVGLDSQTVDNLRAALTQLYPGSTCELYREGTKHHLAITVPGGSADTWPAQIPRPARP